jgi:hypothetical protein
MLFISAALRRRLMPRLTEDKPRVGGLRAWIESGSFYVEQEDRSGGIKLRNASLSELIPFLSYDYERFAFSSFESLLASRPQRPSAVGWPLIKIYYSAFFGAHAMMRATGRGVLRIGSRHAQRISEIAALFAPSVVFQAGTYEFLTSQSNDGSIDVTLEKLPDTGGAHDQFWRRFYLFLSNTGATVSANNEPDATAVVAEIADVQLLLAANGFGSGTWLSEVRNQINYQHEYGVWYPYTATAKVVESVSDMKPQSSSTIRLDYNASKDPIQAFGACCQVVAAMSSDLSTDLCQRRPTHRFSKLWNRLEAGS